MQYKFEVTVDADEDMGFETAEKVKRFIEEVIHETVSAGLTIKMTPIADDLTQ